MYATTVLRGDCFSRKRYKPQTVIFIAGLVLMMAAIIMMRLGYMPQADIVPAKDQTGAIVLDAFEYIKLLLSSNVAGLGFNIMAVGGFARYMDHIGASRALVNVTSGPLTALRSPYLVLSGTWVLGMFIGLAINSASGLAMLLMVTVFPVLISLGVSRVSAVAAIATTLCLDWSPSDTGTLLAAKTANIHFFTSWQTYQVPIAAAVIPVVAVLHFFTQKWMDKRDGNKPEENVTVIGAGMLGEEKKVPLYYALLPVVPLVTILAVNFALFS